MGTRMNTDKHGSIYTDTALARYRPWFYAAAIYNFVWGAIQVLFPSLFFNLIGAPAPNYPALWQVAGPALRRVEIGTRTNTDYSMCSDVSSCPKFCPTGTPLLTRDKISPVAREGLRVGQAVTRYSRGVG